MKCLLNKVDKVANVPLYIQSCQRPPIHFSVAVRIKPDFAKAHYNLGLGLAMQGKLDEAIAHYSEALRINPGFRKARSELQLALEKAGKLDQARRPAKRPPKP